MVRRRTGGNYADNVAGGIAQGLMAYLALARQQETLDQQKALNAAHADYYKAKTAEIDAERADEASFAKLGTPVATEDVPVGAGGPVAAPITSHDLKDNVAPASAPAAALPPLSQAPAKGVLAGLDPRFRDRLMAAAAEQGIDLLATDGFRDFAAQKDVKARKGDLAATPGYSLHGARFAADIDPKQAEQLDQSGALARAGLHRPLAYRAKNPEAWHIEPKGIDTAAVRAAQAEAIRNKQDPTKIDASGFYTPQAQAQEPPLSNMLAEAGTTMSDAGQGYSMRGAKAPAAPAQAAPQPGRGLNPAVAAQAAVPQTRAGIQDALTQRASELQARRAQLEQWNPTSVKHNDRKRVMMKELEQEERWLIDKAETEQRARETAQRQAVTDARNDRREDRAVDAAARAAAAQENTVAHQQKQDARQADNDFQSAGKSWADSVNSYAKEVSTRVVETVDANGTLKKESFVDPRKAEVVREAINAHFDKGAWNAATGEYKHPWMDKSKSHSEISDVAGQFSQVYDKLVDSVVDPKADPERQSAQRKAAFGSLTPEALLRGRDMWLQDRSSQGKPAPAPQAAPASAGQPTPPPAPGSPPPAAPAPDKSRADKVIYNRPEVADSFINSGDASRVEGPKPADPFGPQTGLPTARELGIDLENKRMQDKMEGYRQGIVGGIMPFMPSPATGDADPSLAGDASQVTRPAVPGFGGVGGVVDKLKQGIESLTKRNVDPAELLKRYESATPEERSWIDQNYPQIKDLQNKNLSVVGENGPEVLVTPENQSGYVVPVEDESAYKLLAMGTPGFAEGGDYGGGRDNERDASNGDEGNDGGFHDDRDSGYDGGDGEGDTSGWGGKFSREGSGYGSDNAGDSSDNEYGGIKDGVLSSQFRGAYAAAPSIRAQGMTPAETMDSMDPTQRGTYAANVAGLNDSPFSAFGGDMQSDNTPQSRAGSMFADAKAKQIAESINLGNIVNQGLQAAGYQTAQEAPVGGVWSALVAGDVAPRVTSDYGYRTHPVTGQTQSFHNAVDLAAPAGSMLTTSTNGTVEDVGYQKNLGNYATVRDENGYSYTFGHLDSPSVKTGQTVSAGDVIGQQGATGRVTGEHVHYSVRDPQGGSVNPSTHHGISSRR